MTVATTIRAYYAALRDGDPLAPFFAEAEPLVKFGISERLDGYQTVVAGLREQTRNTTDWRVESSRLRTGSRKGMGWFSDDVAMAWTDTRTDDRHAFETRWSGTLHRAEDWQFVGLHVSAPHKL